MFAILFDTHWAALTVGAFIGTFFIALTFGRLLKRGAGVQLGMLYQLFCLSLAFYVALAVYGVQADWRNHVGAAAILLSTALVVALINRYVWDWYFEDRKKTPIPHFLREVIGGLIFLIALLLVLSVGYHAETQLKGLLAGSGVVAIILGFAGQNFFAGIIAGMSIQLNRPYKVGNCLRLARPTAGVGRSTGVPPAFAPTTRSTSTFRTTRSSRARSLTFITRPKSMRCGFASE